MYPHESSAIIDVQWVPVPDEAPPADDPIIFVVVSGRWRTGDIGGVLMDQRGVPMHSHISSSMSWLTRDLTNGFPNRAQALRERFGEVVRAAVIEDWEKAPSWLVDGNAAWAAKQTPNMDQETVGG